MRSRILLVDQASYRGHAIQRHLTRNGLVVDIVTNVTTATVKTRQGQHALVLLSMDGASAGIDACRAIRRSSAVPIIILSAREDDADTVAALDAGGDDFLIAPFSLPELLARVRAVLRRCGSPAVSERNMFHVDDLTIDLDRREVRVADEFVEVRAKEFDILVAFARRPGVVLTRDQIGTEVWTNAGEMLDSRSRSIDVHISTLRGRLVHSQVRIETVWGVGYKLIADEFETFGAADPYWRDTVDDDALPSTAASVLRR